MNHIRSTWKGAQGLPLAYEYWEKSQGSYRWIALVLEDPLMPLRENQRLLDFLLERRFKVYAVSWPTHSGQALGAHGLKALSSQLAAFIRHLSESQSLPIVALPQSFHALPFLACFLDFRPPLRAVAFLSPVFALPIGLSAKRTCFLAKELTLRVAREDLALPGFEADMGLQQSPSLLHFPRRLIRELERRQTILAQGLSELSSASPCAVFSGEDDRLLGLADLSQVKACSTADCFRYPRMRHLNCLDHHWDNLAQDLLLWLDSK